MRQVLGVLILIAGLAEIANAKEKSMPIDKPNGPPTTSQFVFVRHLLLSPKRYVDKPVSLRAILRCTLAGEFICMALDEKDSSIELDVSGLSDSDKEKLLDISVLDLRGKLMPYNPSPETIRLLPGKYFFKAISIEKIKRYKDDRPISD